MQIMSSWAEQHQTENFWRLNYAIQQNVRREKMSKINIQLSQKLNAILPTAYLLQSKAIQNILKYCKKQWV